MNWAARTIIVVLALVMSRVTAFGQDEPLYETSPGIKREITDKTINKTFGQPIFLQPNVTDLPLIVSPNVSAVNPKVADKPFVQQDQSKVTVRTRSFKVVDDVRAGPVMRASLQDSSAQASVDAYLASPRAVQCSGGLITDGIRYQQPGIGITGDVLTLLRENWKRLDAQCLSKPTPEILTALKASVGAVYHKFNAPFGYYCFGFLVTDRDVLTARHCRFVPDESGNPSSLLPLRSSDGSNRPLMMFFPLGDPDQGISVVEFKDVSGNARFGTDLQDFVILRLERPVANAKPLHISPIGNGDHPQLIILGLSTTGINASGMTVAKPNLDGFVAVNESTSRWVDWIRYSSSPICRIFETSNHDGGQCLIHACSTDGGMSGAALIPIDHLDQSFGIQTKAGTSGQCVSSERTIPNSGIAVSAATINDLVR